MIIQLIEGDLLLSKEKFIAHQCNCVITKGRGLSQALFALYPEADIYSERNTRGENQKVDNPGTIIIREIDENRVVINMLGQFYPGKAKYNNDSRELRKKWFAMCLDQIAEIPGIDTIGFPHLIGCGLAGGDWNDYLAMLTNFSEKSKIDVVIYRLKK